MFILLFYSVWWRFFGSGDCISQQCALRSAVVQRSLGPVKLQKICRLKGGGVKRAESETCFGENYLCSSSSCLSSGELVYLKSIFVAFQVSVPVRVREGFFCLYSRTEYLVGGGCCMLASQAAWLLLECSPFLQKGSPRPSPRML